MNKNIIIAFAWLVLLPFASTAQSLQYEIKGEIKGLKNDTLIFSLMDGKNDKRNFIKVAGNNDKFVVKGEIEKPTLVFAQIVNRRSDGNFIFFLDKGTMNITGSSDRLDETEVTGTPVNDDYIKGARILNEITSARDKIFKEMRGVTDRKSEAFQKLTSKSVQLSDSIQTFQLNYIKKYPASVFSGMQLYVLTDKISVVELETLFNSLQSPARDLIVLKNIPSRILAKKASQVGNVAPSFSSVDMNGKLIRLEDYKGKYVLLDFWASWCVPCRKENPGLIKAYKMFKGKPFEIISVAESDTDAKWRKAIADDKLGDWIHLFDSKDGKNIIGLQYGVQPIPDNFLISPEGKIIARNLFGKALEDKLDEVLGK